MVKNFFAGYNFSRSLIYLYSNRTIQLVGIGLLGLFLPIFLFEKFNNSYYYVILFYLVSYLLTALFVPIGAMLMSKINLKRSMITGVFFLILYLLSFYFYDKSPLLILLIIALIVANFWRMLYWIPFHTDFVKFSSKTHRGQQYSVLVLINDIVL